MQTNNRDETTKSESSVGETTAGRPSTQTTAIRRTQFKFQTVQTLTQDTQLLKPEDYLVMEWPSSPDVIN